MYNKKQNDNHCIEINPKSEVKRSMIWLHGLGADGNDFVPMIPELNLPKSLGVRFIFPHAPIIPVTFNQGVYMRAWYDFDRISFDAKIDREGIDRSSKQIRTYLHHEEERGIPSDQIILAGFSQGAAMALITGLTFNKKLAGIIALSGFLPLADEVLSKIMQVNQSTPVFLAHGIEDPIIPFAWGERVYQALSQKQLPTTYHDYHMMHEVCHQEVKDLRQWILSRYDDRQPTG